MLRKHKSAGIVGVALILGLAAAGTPASAAPLLATAWSEPHFNGVAMPLVGNQNVCTSFPVGFTAHSAKMVEPAVGDSVALFSSNVCTGLVATLTSAAPSDDGCGTTLGSSGARSYRTSY